MKIEMKKEKIRLIPEKSMDYFHCGIIHAKLRGLYKATLNTDDPKMKLEYIEISNIDVLINFLLKKI